MRGADLRRTMLRAPMMYVSYEIPKRNGGVRLISHPAREVKLLQRALIRTLLDDLPIHSAATAYRKGKSILDNAKPHATSGPILKLDLKEFFPSIRSADWVKYCERTGCLSDYEEILLSSHLLFRREKYQRVMRLAIGAPSSPILSNILMYDFDHQILEAVSKNKVIYTRYADDMTFSAPRTGHLTGVMRDVAQVIRLIKSPKLSINAEKTTYATKKYHRSVTGITLTNDGNLSIGRESKRKMHATVHRAVTVGLPRPELQVLAGALAYVNAVEPGFLETLRVKYGFEAIEAIQKIVFSEGRLKAHAPPIAPFDRD